MPRRERLKEGQRVRREVHEINVRRQDVAALDYKARWLGFPCCVVRRNVRKLPTPRPSPRIFPLQAPPGGNTSLRRHNPGAFAPISLRSAQAGAIQSSRPCSVPGRDGPNPPMIFGKRTPSQAQASERDSAQTVYSSQMSGEGLEREYEDIVRAQLTKLGVPLDSVAVEVRPAGAMKAGRNISLGMVRLVRCPPRPTLRLLVALPLLELKTRQSLETTWLMDVSHFGGLWVHASSTLRNAEVMGDIRDAVSQLELGTASTPSSGSDAGWSASVQAALDDAEPPRTRR